MNDIQAFAAVCREGVAKGLDTCSAAFATCVEGAQSGLQSVSSVAVEWKGHVVRELRNVATAIHNNPALEFGLKIASILVINTLFFLAINELLRRFNHWLENQDQPIQYRIFKQVFVNGILPGAAVAGFNALLSLAIPMSPWLIVGMTAAAIATRLLCNRFVISEQRTQANIARDQVNMNEVLQLRQQVAQIPALQAQITLLEDLHNAKDLALEVEVDKFRKENEKLKNVNKENEKLKNANTDLLSENGQLKLEREPIIAAYKKETGKEWKGSSSSPSSSPPGTPVKPGSSSTSSTSSSTSTTDVGEGLKGLWNTFTTGLSGNVGGRNPPPGTPLTVLFSPDSPPTTPVDTSKPGT